MTKKRLTKTSFDEERMREAIRTSLERIAREADQNYNPNLEEAIEEEINYLVVEAEECNS